MITIGRVNNLSITHTTSVVSSLYAEIIKLETNGTIRIKDFLEHNIGLYAESSPKLHPENDDIRQLLAVLKD